RAAEHVCLRTDQGRTGACIRNTRPSADGGRGWRHIRPCESFATRSTLTCSRVIHFMRSSIGVASERRCVPISIWADAKPLIAAHARSEHAAATRHALYAYCREMVRQGKHNGDFAP